MFAIQRQNKIKEILLQKKSITVSEMAKECKVTLETIRRDFEVLKSEGFLLKVYGGAVLRDHAQADFSVLPSVLMENKLQMAGKAAEFILPGDCIFIDHSSTALCILDQLKNINITNLNVMTNSYNALSKLLEYPGVSAMATGGALSRESGGLFGPAAVNFFSHYHLDKVFLSCCALHREKGLSDRTEQEAQLHNAAIINASHVYLMMDHTKFDKSNFARVCDWGTGNITTLITDEPLNTEWKEFLRSRQIDFCD